jgi:transitional endoplasmic reticulum ATPase
MNAKPALVRPSFASDLEPQVALWICRLSISYPAALYQFDDNVYSDDIRKMVGISPAEGKLRNSDVRTLLKTRVVELEQLLPSRKTVLETNVAMLGKLLGLDKQQEQIFNFAALTQHHNLLLNVVESIRTSNLDGLATLLACALKVAVADIKKAMQAGSPMLETRILNIKRSEIGRGMQILLPSGLLEVLFATAKNTQELMGAFLENAPAANLTADAFVHVKSETELLNAYLSGARSSEVRGVNILIYGPPGTGKTEYARWLAQKLGKELYQVRATDAQGEPISGLDRVVFYQLSQRFLQNSDALVLFDEIEDVFPADDGGPFFRPRRAPAGKMFINRMLESNPVPTLWISNEVGHIDKAYRRRFDFSFEMGIPPIAVRRDILAKYLHGYRISKETIKYLSQQEELSPAQIEKAAKILKLSWKKVADREASLLQVIENSMALLEQTKNEKRGNLADGCYQLDYLNPDCDLQQLVAQLKRAPKSVGALCFYGAPGTGKTALAHYLAQEIELPLHVRRASDILSPYVGETEQKIAQMFKEARQDEALLLLDEADSFLSERKSAKNSWEITAVNEMLTQMERFDGLFICSTNLMQRLDEASLRRFALKIKFDYLKPEQRWRLFLDQAKKFPSSRESVYRSSLNQLNNLTPGDFATVRRQTKLVGTTLTADELLKRLIQECKCKSDSGNRPIGFIRTQ